MFAGGMLSGPGPMLSPAMLDKQSIPKNSTLSSMAKGKSLQLIENRIYILQYFKDTHVGRRPWLNSSPIAKQRWQQMYCVRRGSRSYYSIGVSLAAVMDRTYPTLKDYVFAITVVLQYYEYYDSKKSMIPLEKQAQLPAHTSGLTTVNSRNSITSESTDSNGSVNGAVSPSGFRQSFKGGSRRFTLGKGSILSGTSSTSKESTSSHPALIDDSKTAFKAAAPALSSKKAGDLLAVTPAAAASSEKKGRKAANISAPFAKNPNAMAVLASLNTQSEEELSYLPDTYESLMTLIDSLIIMFYNISYQLRGRKLVFLELNDIEDNLKTIDEILRRCVTGEIQTMIVNDPMAGASSPTNSGPTPGALTALFRDSEQLERQMLMLR